MDAPANVEAGRAIEAASARRAPAQSAPGWLEYLGASGVAKVLILAGLLAWMYHDHIYRLYRYWLQPDWSHGFLIPPFCLLLVHFKRQQLMAGEHRGSLAGLVIMLLSTAVYAAALYYKFGYPQPLSIVSMIAGVVLLTCGWRTLWLTSFPIAFLVLAMPPPERIYRAVTQPLQQGAAFIATAVLNCFPGADVERSGINISYWVQGYGNGMFTVAGACSGMRSLMAFAALGLAMAYLTPRPLWHRITMACVVIPVALFCNVIRVIATGALQMYGQGGLAAGSPHMVLGLMTFALGFVIFLAILWVLDHLHVETAEAGTPGEWERAA